MTEQKFSRLLRGKQTEYGVPDHRMKEYVGVSLRTMHKYMSNPKSMRVADLMIVCKRLHINSEDLINFLKETE